VTDELRSAIVPRLERLAQDVTTGRYGDPYVAAIVLVYPDREPAVLIVYNGRPAYDLTKTVSVKSDEPQPAVRFPLAELGEAADAVTDAYTALKYGSYSDKEPGEVVAEKIRKHWNNRRTFAIDKTLKAAAEQAARPEVCPHCKDRFTTRGIKMHLARARWCSQQESKT
jgi:hypothetical protein